VVKLNQTSGELAETYASPLFLAYLFHYAKTRRKCVTYCIAVTGVPSHGHM